MAGGPPLRSTGSWPTRSSRSPRTYLARYDRTRFCPGVDEVPTESVTLLETNPRFIASFMVGLNHETNRELLWRRYPTDQPGTPFRHFWARLDGQSDIAPMHEWPTAALADQTTDPKGNLVLLLRGELLHRYPNTIVVAIRATAPDKPIRARPTSCTRSSAAGSTRTSRFFGFPLHRADVVADPGWFFALMEPLTEPRFGLDENVDPPRPWEPTPAPGTTSPGATCRSHPAPTSTGVTSWRSAFPGASSRPTGSPPPCSSGRSSCSSSASTSWPRSRSQQDARADSTSPPSPRPAPLVADGQVGRRDLDVQAAALAAKRAESRAGAGIAGQPLARSRRSSPRSAS